MKVALIHHAYSHGGGMESYLFTLLQGFLAAGHRVDVHVMRADNKATRFANARVLSYFTGKLPIPHRLRKFCFIHQHAKQFRREDYDLSIALTLTHHQDMIACGGIHQASIERLNLQKSGFSRWKDEYEIQLERKAYEKTPHILACSQLIQREILQYHPHIPREKIHVAYPPINEKRFQPLSAEIIFKVQQQYHINPEKLNVFFPSLGHHLKGFQELLAAFSQLNPKKYHLWIAGRNPKLKLPQNVSFLGHLNTIEKLYPVMDFTVLPSRYEAFGLVVIESLQCGTPVIISKHVGAGELVGTGEGIILNEVTPEAIYTTLRSLNKHLTTQQHIDDLIMKSGK
ncbi:MAG: glycosyltransferase family 4 protein [Legionellales bacterium]|nr:glycosyltransferase family 4 protein [Legionellales bacterium]